MMKKKIRLRHLTGYMAIMLAASSVISGCSSGSSSLSLNQPASSESSEKPDETGNSENGNSENGNSENGNSENGNSGDAGSLDKVYLAEAADFVSLSVEERANIDLGDGGYLAISQFTEDTLYSLYMSVCEEEDKNFVYSPTSLYLALSVLAECEDSEASEEIYELLGVTGSDEMVELVQRMRKSLISDGEGDICKIANSIWAMEGYPWYDEAAQIWNRAADNLGADIFQMDLHSEEAGVLKNRWISDNTGGLLGNGKPEPWTDDVKMVIMNTVYFDKKWYAPFENYNTFDNTFTKSDGSEIICQMMHTDRNGYSYLEEDSYIASALNYRDGSYMLFMLPNEGYAPEDLLKNDLTDAVQAYRQGDTKTADLVNFAVPKFDYSTEIKNIQVLLSELGLDKAFKVGAFKNLTDGELVVSSVSQNARIIVDEKGTKAAAVTEIACTDEAFFAENIVNINLNRPYAYAVVSANGIILFAGVVNDPAKE